MTTRKRATRKPKADPKPVPEVEVVEAPAEPEYIYDEVPAPEPTSRLRSGCLIASIVLVLMLMFTMALAVAGGAAWWYFSSRGGNDGGKPDGPRTALVEQIEAAMPGDHAAHNALYLSKACRGLAGRLQADFANPGTVYDQRSELTALAGMAGRFSMLTDDEHNVQLASLYPRLPDVIRSELANALGGETPEGGPATDADRTQIVTMFNRLADAFAEVAK